jgi:hypothetical protein
VAKVFRGGEKEMNDSTCIFDFILKGFSAIAFFLKLKRNSAPKIKRSETITITETTTTTRTKTIQRIIRQ